MPLSPLEHDRRYGELDQVMRAYAGQPADDTADKPSQALTAYLWQTWHSRPWALAIAERQREYADNPPGRLRLRLGEFYPIPDMGSGQLVAKSRGVDLWCAPRGTGRRNPPPVRE